MEYANGTGAHYKGADVELVRSCLEEPPAQDRFAYLREVAELNPLKTDDGQKLLLMQYQKIDFVSDRSAAALYLNPGKDSPRQFPVPQLIYPFGCNASQQRAIQAAFGNQISIIQGPPGTGKTQTILNIVANLVVQEKTVLVTNFVYEKEGAKRKKVMNYHTAFPKDKVFTWKDVKFFMTGQYILMHSVIYRTELLRQCGLELPKHTFYVDNIFVYQPLPHVKNMYYLDVNFYRYFIGRSDQSVNEQVMIGRIDQQLRVTKLMLGYYDVTKIPNRKLKHYMTSYLEIMMTICSVLAIKSGTEENMEKKKELWESLKKQNLALWLRLRFGFLGQGCNLPGKGGRELLILGYKITQKFYGFN